ncbi:helix-turn-helix transcriptional regulator [Crocosphaera sp.]|uniref:helix-turn-helix domain-containing protein n=1 Tax=Crocosphaera sp. TaxID=2729996 RepID=UPI0026156262|nr:helix-turn-helix transcriptional regulator [Crocosphaera sp.]MDJ0582964.1 helix-turn-helix transcriptional regulator [Crocosphaera sp.]
MDKNLCTTDKPLKELIKQHGYTQKSFATALKKHVSAVTAYIAGKKSPTIAVVADMCRLLDESPKTVMKSLGIDVSGIPDDHIDDQ